MDQLPGGAWMLSAVRYFLEGTFFLPATVLAGPFRVRAFV